MDIKTVVNNTMKFHKNKINEGIEILNKEDLKILKNLKKNKNIIISKPDKGRGVVIFNKEDYLNKMDNTLSDISSFKKINNVDPLKNTLCLEDKLNRFIRKLKDSNKISEQEYKTIYASGSNPGILYGLPKIHKPSIPLRPVLSSFKTHNYQLAKFIIPEIDTYAKNEFSLNNSYEFFEDIKNINLNNENFLVSLDITSLYTNVPKCETISILTSKIYDENNSSFRNLSKKEFKKMLEIAINDTFYFQ